MKELTVAASTDKLEHVLNFINLELESHDFPMKAQMQIAIVVEEIFINIANYAYYPAQGYATVYCKIESDPLSVTIQFLDSGRPYNPLEKSDPDTTLSAEERSIGGLGIFMVKKIMDEIYYQYNDQKNILTLKKVCS
ncbi:ATP-binding protein [Oscillospiraceae bacterium LTW-04]|nr:ATP-binding protein [Oscillospiraceae bacterium MB24-C1]